jgi:hypothetical protein
VRTSFEILFGRMTHILILTSYHYSYGYYGDTAKREWVCPLLKTSIFVSSTSSHTFHVMLKVLQRRLCTAGYVFSNVAYPLMYNIVT